MITYDRNDHGDFYIEQDDEPGYLYIDYLCGKRQLIIPKEEFEEFYDRAKKHYIELEQARRAEIMKNNPNREKMLSEIGTGKLYSSEELRRELDIKE